MNVLNGEIETLDTMPEEFDLENLKRLVDMKMNVLTAARMTGSKNVVEWSDLARKWEHLLTSNFRELVLTQLLTFLLVSIMWTCIIHTGTYTETLENPL